MEFNDILQQAAKSFKARLDLNGDGSVDVAEVGNALKALLSDENGEINLAGLVDKLKSSGLAEVAESWLGDGKNEAVRGGQLAEIFGKEKIAAFAEKLGLRQVTALNGLSDAVPQVVDKSSSGGSLLEGLLASVGGVAGVVEMAKKALSPDADTEEKSADEAPKA